MELHTVSIKTVHTSEDGIDQGGLSVFEGGRDVDFDIKRIYYIHGTKAGVLRGGHAHKRLKQLLFCPYGSVEILLDDGTEKASILLDRPEIGLVVEHYMWREMLWKQDNSVLCVAASEYYDEDDYIRNYEAFLAAVHGGEKQ